MDRLNEYREIVIAGKFVQQEWIGHKWVNATIAPLPRPIKSIVIDDIVLNFEEEHRAVRLRDLRSKG